MSNFWWESINKKRDGCLIEKFQRSQKMQAILGGSEEIMADFAMRQAIKSVGKGEMAAEFSRM